MPLYLRSRQSPLTAFKPCKDQRLRWRVQIRVKAICVHPLSIHIVPQHLRLRLLSVLTYDIIYLYQYCSNIFAIWYRIFETYFLNVFAVFRSTYTEPLYYRFIFCSKVNLNIKIIKLSYLIYENNLLRTVTQISGNMNRVNFT